MATSGDYSFYPNSGTNAEDASQILEDAALIKKAAWKTVRRIHADYENTHFFACRVSG